MSITTAQEINRIIELTLPHRDRIVKDIAKAFPGREAHALGVALACLFATSMTSDPAQQSDQAEVLNEVLARWGPHRVPWQLAPGP